MKRKLLSLLSVAILFIISCTKESSKEQDHDDPTPVDTSGNNPQTKLVTRIVDYESDYPADSTVTDYFYNNDGKLIRIKEKWFTTATNVGYEDEENIIYRNNDNTIKRMVVIRSHYIAPTPTNIDSSVYDVVYDAAAKRYKYSIFTTNFDDIGTPYFIHDSIVYTYNNKNQLFLWQALRKDRNTNTLFEAERREAEYDAKGNIVKFKYNENYQNNGDPLREDIMEYDDKINPLNFGIDGFLFGVDFFAWPTPNNPVKFNNEISTKYLYTYDADKYPRVVEYISADGNGKSYLYYNK